MSAEDDLRRLQEETWPDLRPIDRGVLGIHRTVRLEVTLHASGAMLEAAKILRATADALESDYRLKGPNLEERSLILLLADRLWAAQTRLNALCPWRREHKRRMTLLRQDSAADPTPLSRYKR